MIRIKLDLESTKLLDRITSIYGFKRDSITSRIALALSIENGKSLFDLNTNLPSNGREYTPTNNVFGKIVNDVDNYVIYKTIFDQYYKKELSENEFVRLYKLHLNHGLKIWDFELGNGIITNGDHISYLLKSIQKGLTLRSKVVKVSSDSPKLYMKSVEDVLELELGKTEDGETVKARLNDLREFDNRNMAIAGMAGSGKTQLIKDILYQMSVATDNNLKFIFFDYKGEGNPNQLETFLSHTKCKFIDIIDNGGINFNPFTSISLEERQKPFSIRAFVDTISMFVPKMGVSQQNILITIIDELLEEKDGKYPSVLELFERLNEYYEENRIRQDTLYSVIRDLSTNIFNCEPNDKSIFSDSIYLNLPPALSDTLRQLIVFLLLRYFNSYFSSTNDCEPTNYIIPLRYVIVIDEAHIYLKNKNARKALEDLLRLLRSKGVIVVMLSQGVEDYRTKDFDFASQVKLPICLNIQNKDYKAISSFVGTPTSKYKLESEIAKLESGKGLINFGEPKTIKLKQWWETEKELKHKS
jgi:DNA sulfur modification protein DndE